MKITIDWFQEIDDCIRNSLICLALNISQQSETKFPLRQGNNCLVMTFANDRIPFPVTQALAVIHDQRLLVDTDPVFERTTPAAVAIALPAESQMAKKAASCVLVQQNVLSDPFMADLKVKVVLQPPQVLFQTLVLADHRSTNNQVDGLIHGSGPWRLSRANLCACFGRYTRNPWCLLSSRLTVDL